MPTGSRPLSKRGRPRKEQQDGEHPHRPYTQGEAAELLGVSRREVGYVARIYAPDSGVDPEVLRAVEQGEISAGDAPNAIGEAEDVQREALARVLGGDVMTIGRAIRQVKREATLREEDTPALESAPATPVGEAVTLYHSPVSACTGWWPWRAWMSSPPILRLPPAKCRCSPSLSALRPTRSGRRA